MVYIEYMVWFYIEGGEVNYGIYRVMVWDIMEGCGIYVYLFTIKYVCFDIFVCLRFDGWRCDRDMMEMVWRLYLASVWVCDGIMVYGIWYMALWYYDIYRVMVLWYMLYGIMILI